MRRCAAGKRRLARELCKRAEPRKRRRQATSGRQARFFAKEVPRRMAPARGLRRGGALRTQLGGRQRWCAVPRLRRYALAVRRYIRLSRGNVDRAGRRRAERIRHGAGIVCRRDVRTRCRGLCWPIGRVACERITMRYVIRRRGSGHFDLWQRFATDAPARPRALAGRHVGLARPVRQLFQVGRRGRGPGPGGPPGPGRGRGARCSTATKADST